MTYPGFSFSERRRFFIKQSSNFLVQIHPIVGLIFMTDPATQIILLSTTPHPIFIAVVHTFIIFLTWFIILPLPHFPTPNNLFFSKLVGMMDPTYSYEEHLFDFALFHSRLCISYIKGTWP